MNKFAPKTLDEFIDNKDSLEKIVKCINENKPALIISPPGYGKTTSAHLIADYLGYTLKEFNASDERKKTDLQEIKRIVSTKTFTKVLLLLDECDGFENQTELSLILKKSKIPIILTANDKYKVKELAKISTVIEFEEPSYQSIVKRIKSIDPNVEIKLDTDIRSSLNRTFYGGDKYTKVQSDFDKVIDVFKNHKQIEIDPVWLLDNVSQFFFGNSVLEALETIKLYEKTKNPKTLIFPEALSSKPKYPNYYRCLAQRRKNGHN